MEVHRLDISHLASLAVSKLPLHPISIKSIILRAGLTVGRILLLWVNKKVGERRVMFMYAALAIGYDLIVCHHPCSLSPFPALNLWSGLLRLSLGMLYLFLSLASYLGQCIPLPWITRGRFFRHGYSLALLGGYQGLAKQGVHYYHSWQVQWQRNGGLQAYSLCECQILALFVYVDGMWIGWWWWWWLWQDYGLWCLHTQIGGMIETLFMHDDLEKS